MNLKYTSISNLLLLPESYNIEEDDDVVQSILKQHKVFNELYKLEESIQTVLVPIEEAGLLVANEWFKSGLKQKHVQQRKIATEINQYISGGASDHFEPSRLHEFWRRSHLPIANSFDSLKRYKNLHSTYHLMLTYKNNQSYLKMWEHRLLEKGVVVDGGVLLKGTWRSFSSYTGRITARNLPLTSMPSAMRDYIVPPTGQQIVSLDLDNAELRFLAHYAECDSLKEQFNQGIDIHAETAKLIRRNTAEHEVNDEQARKLAKQFTYSLLYGAGRQTITQTMEKIIYSITNADVVALIDEFYELYPELLVFLEERADSSKLLTPFGEIEPVAKFTRTQKKNYALQAGVAVAIKLLMTTLAGCGIKITHVLHDEAWILMENNMYLDKLIKQVEVKFEKKLKNLFPGLPTNGILTKEKIGGTYNE